MNSIIKVVLVLLCAINSYFAITSAPFAYPRLLILGLTGVDQSENDCLDGVIQEEIDELKKEADSNKDHLDSIDFELRNEIKDVKQQTSSLNIQVGVARDLIYSNQDNVNLNIDHINDLNLTLQNDISSLNDLVKTLKDEVMEFQCPTTSNNLGDLVCNLDDSLNQDEITIHTMNQFQADLGVQISRNTPTISVNSKAVSSLDSMDTTINAQIADLTSRLSQLENEVNEFSVCSNSAQHSLGIDRDSNGRYVGNCNSGNVFTPSGCRFECKSGTEFTFHYVTCGTVECKGSGMWSITGHGCPCCKATVNQGVDIFQGCC